jgi:hypothetical protein
LANNRAGLEGFHLIEPWFILPIMRGKTGHWGTPFTKENANVMRERGLVVRRAKAATRLIGQEKHEAAQELNTKWEMRELRPGVWEQIVLDSPRLRAERAKQFDFGAQPAAEQAASPVAKAVEASAASMTVWPPAPGSWLRVGARGPNGSIPS